MEQRRELKQRPRRPANRRKTQEQIEAIRKKRREKRMFAHVLVYSSAALILLLVVFGLSSLIYLVTHWDQVTGKTENAYVAGETSVSEEVSQSGDKKPASLMDVSAEREEAIHNALMLARVAMDVYDYEQAGEILDEMIRRYPSDQELIAAKVECETAKQLLVAYEGTVEHISFHSLIVDTARAFDGDASAAGYNNWMITTAEFISILDALYENGYVLVNLHDLNRSDLMLPAGKKAFVLYVDDVNYYHYMEGDGFAGKLVIDKEGNVKSEYTDPVTGKVLVGNYDVVPLLDSYVETHPGFSYKNAKGVVALTGYNGCLGYRYRELDNAAKTYRLVEHYEVLMKQAREVAEAMKAEGWSFANHSWGHLHIDKLDYDTLKADTKLWEAEVMQITGKTDIYVYPYAGDYPENGADVKIAYLQEQGYVYFCSSGAISSATVYDSFVGISRRNIDGFTMHYMPERLADLFDVSEIYDRSRPEFSQTLY